MSRRDRNPRSHPAVPGPVAAEPALWRVAGYCLLALFALGLSPVTVRAAAGAAGTAMIAARYVVRRRQRRRDRVRLVPLGGMFPVAASVASVATVVAMVVLQTTGVASGPALGVLAYAAMGLVITYGGRMLRMLVHQVRGRGEFA